MAMAMHLSVLDYVEQKMDSVHNMSVKSRAFMIENILYGEIKQFPSQSKKMNHYCKHHPVCQRQIQVQLCKESLWKEFNTSGTEMLMTRNGRFMFPTLKVNIQGLDPESYYMIWLEMHQTDNYKYQYDYYMSKWKTSNEADLNKPVHNTYVHPASGSQGNTWESFKEISFERLKLTNRWSPDCHTNGQMCLRSLCHYQPRIHIQKVDNPTFKSLPPLDPIRSKTFTFSETAFVAVTAYQNQSIAQLKIKHNPYARGFRRNGRILTRETMSDVVRHSLFEQKAISAYWSKFRQS